MLNSQYSRSHTHDHLGLVVPAVVCFRAEADPVREPASDLARPPACFFSELLAAGAALFFAGVGSPGLPSLTVAATAETASSAFFVSSSTFAFFFAGSWGGHSCPPSRAAQSAGQSKTGARSSSRSDPVLHSPWPCSPLRSRKGPPP